MKLAQAFRYYLSGNRIDPTGVKGILFIVFVFLFIHHRAQVFYSTNPNYLKVKTEKNNLVTEPHFVYPDTSLSEFANYFPRNFMGSVGLPSPNYLFKYSSDQIGFRFFQPPTVIDRVTEEQVPYYRTKGPYANLTGIAGAKNLQIFKMLFTHTYKERVNITVQFQRSTAIGFYLRQQSAANNLIISSNYETRNKRFGYYLFLLNNSNKNNENGGISDGSLNDTTMHLIKEVLPHNLSNANRDNRETKFMFNPYFRLNRLSDSSVKFDQFIQIKSKLSRQTFKYKDDHIADDGFYHVAYLDTVLTHDSSNVTQFVNELDYTLRSRNRNLSLSMGAKNEMNRVWQKADSVFSNTILLGDVAFIIPIQRGREDALRQYRVENHFNAQFVVDGANKGNYKAEWTGFLDLHAAKKRNLQAALSYENRNPDYIYNYWVSNHFQWFNLNYDPQQQLQFILKLGLGKDLQLSAYQQNLNNFLYFDKEALPAQYKGSISNTALSLNYTHVFFKHLGIGINHLYQNTTGAAYVRIPQNVSTTKLFYHGNLFRNNLQLQIGAQLQIYEPFTPYNYMPATQVFYLQDEVRTDDYPYVDVYLNARIRPVTVFFKVENALQGYAGPNYFFVPGYYQTDRAFRCGISWMFFD